MSDLKKELKKELARLQIRIQAIQLLLDMDGGTAPERGDSATKQPTHRTPHEWRKKEEGLRRLYEHVLSLEGQRAHVSDLVPRFAPTTAAVGKKFGQLADRKLARRVSRGTYRVL